METTIVKKSASKITLKMALLTSAMFSSVSFAQVVSKGRMPISADSHPLGKIVVLINQVGGEKVSYGNGFIIGKDGCHVVTNFHVAFAKDKTPKGKLVLVDNVDVGHEVMVQADLNSRTGQFSKRNLKARVVEFGDFRENSEVGMREDMAVLKLETCLGKEFGIAKFEPSEQGVHVPKNGRISTLSISKDETLKNEMFLEEDCVAASGSPVAGVFGMNCKLISGMSGSMVFNKDLDGGYTIVGMSSRTIGGDIKTAVSMAIFASHLTPFVESVIGTETTKIPLMLGSNGQDATTTAQSPVRGRTVVR
jgi:hypothetical protein